MTTTARVGTPTDQELLHIDDRRVCGYDPLAQPALIKYGEYNRLPPTASDFRYSLLTSS
jgi:hypothetical protein